MPIITVLSVTPITEHYREAVIEDRFYRRINVSVSNQQLVTETQQTDEQVVQQSIALGFIPAGLQEYVVSYNVFNTDINMWVAGVEAFDRETEETVQTPTIKAPLHLLPADFDNLTVAEQHEALIAYGRSIGQVNWPWY